MEVGLIELGLEGDHALEEEAREEGFGPIEAVGLGSVLGIVV